MLLSDEQLASAYLTHNDERAFSALVARHQERIFGYLLGMVRDRNVANDLFQETFLRVIRAMQNQRGSYAQQDRWLAWVMRIARNATLDYLRSRRKWQDVPDQGDDDAPSFWERLTDDTVPADELLHRAQQHDWLEACIDRLSPEQREVLLLRHEADMTFKEIAQLTDCSINTALGRMRYALLNLRKMMNDKKKVPTTELTELL
ncbi:MAG: sigma-70 family RNA polymerase sigma factor [Rhodothermales bacterium]|nr:sigma-70 family RNA polymerase sigma factor [Rhodothermales bacterium]